IISSDFQGDDKGFKLGVRLIDGPSDVRRLFGAEPRYIYVSGLEMQCNDEPVWRIATDSPQRVNANRTFWVTPGEVPEGFYETQELQPGALCDSGIARWDLVSPDMKNFSR